MLILLIRCQYSNTYYAVALNTIYTIISNITYKDIYNVTSINIRFWDTSNIYKELI